MDLAIKTQTIVLKNVVVVAKTFVWNAQDSVVAPVADSPLVTTACLSASIVIMFIAQVATMLTK